MSRFIPVCQQGECEPSLALEGLSKAIAPANTSHAASSDLRNPGGLRYVWAARPSIA